MNVINGDLLSIQKGVLLHQVNCKGVMGYLAGAIAAKYPRVKQEYLKLLSNKDIRPMGVGQSVKVNDDLYVGNLFAQYNPGLASNEKEQEDRYTALNISLKDLRCNLYTDWASDLPVYIPYGIGSGAAGGDWNRVLPILEEVFPEATLVKYNGGNPRNQRGYRGGRR